MTSRKIATYIALLPVYLSSFLVPRTDIWVMTGGDGSKFEGNTKYLFLHIENNNLDKDVFWISTNKQTCKKLRENGYSAFHKHSIQGIYYSFRAEKAFITHSIGSLNWWAIGSAEVINLWHGMPLKRIEWDTNEYQTRSIIYNLGYKYIIGKFDKLCISTRNFLSLFKSAFRITEDQIWCTGFPRNDSLYEEIPGSEIDQINFKDDSEFLFAYVPTWRQNQNSPLDEWGVDLDALNELLEEKNGRLIIKLHPLSTVELEPEEYERISVVNKSGDIYPTLPNVDCLITDYSSIYFDYLHLDNPIIFYPYDMASYTDQRGLYFNYQDVAPGPIVENPDGLLREMKKVLQGIDESQGERELIRQLFFDYKDGNSAKRVYIQSSE